MAVDSSCQAVLEVQAQDLICLSPCQSGEDCLGLTAKHQGQIFCFLDSLRFLFPQIPSACPGIKSSDFVFIWHCVKLLEVSFSPLVLSCVRSFDESSKHYKRGTSLHSVPPQLWRWGTRDVRWQTWSLGGCQATRIIAGVATISEVEQMAFLRNKPARRKQERSKNIPEAEEASNQGQKGPAPCGCHTERRQSSR